MYLLENSIMTLDFKSHTALTMVIILFLYFKYFLYPTHRAAAPLLYSCSAMNFWSVLWLPYVFMELHKYITILWKEIQNGCTVPVIIAELMLYRMCSVFSKLTFFFFPPRFNRNCPSYCLLHSNGSRTAYSCSWSVDSYQKEEPRWLVGRRAPS